MSFCGCSVEAAKKSSTQREGGPRVIVAGTLHYYSDDDDVDEETWQEYNKQRRQSEGFEIDLGSRVLSFNMIAPMSNHADDEKQSAVVYCKLGLLCFNASNKTNFKFVKFLRVCIGPGSSGLDYYLTFEARCENDELGSKPLCFRALVRTYHHGTEVIFCKLHPDYCNTGLPTVEGLDDTEERLMVYSELAITEHGWKMRRLYEFVEVLDTNPTAATLGFESGYGITFSARDACAIDAEILTFEALVLVSQGRATTKVKSCNLKPQLGKVAG